MDGFIMFSETRAAEPVSEAGAECLRTAFTKVAHCVERVRAADEPEPESVHQLRVATRRAGAALRAFRHLLTPRRAESLARRLRKLRRAAGAVRDCDVQLQLLQSAIDVITEPHQSTLQFLLAAIREERADALGRLARRVQRIRVQSLAPKRAERGRTGTAANQKQGIMIDEARRQLQRNIAKVRQMNPAGRDDQEALHRLRVAGKRLRYTMELFAGCYGPEFQRELYPTIKTLQDFLGAINDHHNLLAQINDVRKRSKHAAVRASLRYLRKHFRGQLDEKRAAYEQFRRDRLNPAFLQRLAAVAGAPHASTKNSAPEAPRTPVLRALK